MALAVKDGGRGAGRAAMGWLSGLCQPGFLRTRHRLSLCRRDCRADPAWAPKTLYNRFVRWAAKDVCLDVFHALAASGGATRYDNIAANFPLAIILTAAVI